MKLTNENGPNLRVMQVKNNKLVNENLYIFKQ